MEKISIRLNRERDGGYESGAGQYVPAAPYRGRFLPPGGVTDRMLPAIRGKFSNDVREHDDEVIVVADLQSIEKDDVSLQILNPRTLEISCERKGEKEENSEGYYVRERVNGSMQQMVTMPADVTVKDAKASFKNVH